MVKRIPLIDATTGNREVLEGELVDPLPKDGTIIVDPRSGTAFRPGDPLSKLPQNEVLSVPDTTWYGGPS